MLDVLFCISQGLKLGGSGEDHGNALDDDNEGKYYTNFVCN